MSFKFLNRCICLEVEFAVHIVIVFLTTIGNRNERMASCLEHMFIPIIHGGFSTLLGLLMLAFTPFDFIFKYFFAVMTALILIGLFNGLFLLPVILSLFGPPCEVNFFNNVNCLINMDIFRLFLMMDRIT